MDNNKNASIACVGKGEGGACKLTIKELCDIAAVADHPKEIDSIEHIEIPQESILDKWVNENIKNLTYIELRNFISRIRSEKKSAKALFNTMTLCSTMSDIYNGNYTNHILKKINDNRLDSLKLEGKNIQDSISEYSKQFDRIEQACNEELKKYNDIVLTSSFLSREYVKTINHNVEYEKSKSCASECEKYERDAKLSIYEKQVELYQNRQSIIDYFMNVTYANNKKYFRKARRYLKGMMTKTFNTTKKNLCRFISEDMLGVFEHEMRKAYDAGDAYGTDEDKIIRLFVSFYMILDRHISEIDNTIISIIVLNVNDIAAGIFDIENPKEHMEKMGKLLEIV